MPIAFDASSITQFHDRKLVEPGWPRQHEAAVAAGPWHWIETNHLFNYLVWREEDKARRTDVKPEAIANAKRLIDQYKQQRNDAVEALDEAVLAELDRSELPFGARLHSETVGAMVDRLSILALKIHHMQAQTRRRNTRAEHIAQCRAKHARLVSQRIDLAGCLDSLLHDAQSGRAYFKVYRQFTMVNDPTLNPYLYAPPRPAR